MRTLIVSSALSLITSIVIAVALGSPISLLLGVSTTGVLVAQIVERLFTARKQAASEAEARWAKDAHRRSPLEFIERAHPPSWWVFGLEPPHERRVRLGTLIERGSPRVLAADLSGGCFVAGPEHVAEAAVLALNLSAALEYAPHESMPVIAHDGVEGEFRWRLDVSPNGRGELVDQLGERSPVDGIEVDLVPAQFVQVMASWRAPACVITPASIDLDRDGPHAMVIGATGSGKTEFLLAFLAGMAKVQTADDLAIVVFDFKGGGSFASLCDLPHLRHLVTDLDPRATRRAIAGLRSLVLSRERLLAARGVSHLDQVDPGEQPPRVVIVVDEFAHLSRLHPQALAVFEDIAARGRALGLHLVVATQRFARSGLESLAANIALRVCFRVTDSAESVAVVGDARAASPLLEPGHGLIARSGQPVVTLEVTVGERPELSSVGGQSQPPLWLEGLTHPLSAPEATLAFAREHGFVFGTRDDHERLERIPVKWLPREGALIVAGARACREQLTAVFAGQGLTPAILAGDPSEVWDSLFALAAGQASVAGFKADAEAGLALAIPFLDETVTSLPLPWRDDFLDEVVRQALRCVDLGAPVMLGVTANSALLRRLEVIASQQLNLHADVAATTAEWVGPSASAEQSLDLMTGKPFNTPTRPLPQAFLRAGDTLITPYPRPWEYVGSAGVRVVTPDEWIFSSRENERGRVFLSGCTPADARALRLSALPLPPPRNQTLLELTAEQGYRRVALTQNRVSVSTD